MQLEMERLEVGRIQVCWAQGLSISQPVSVSFTDSLSPGLEVATNSSQGRATQQTALSILKSPSTGEWESGMG